MYLLIIPLSGMRVLKDSNSLFRHSFAQNGENRIIAGQGSGNLEDSQGVQCDSDAVGVTAVFTTPKFPLNSMKFLGGHPECNFFRLADQIVFRQAVLWPDQPSPILPTFASQVAGEGCLRRR